jgi:hypothetical protein
LNLGGKRTEDSESDSDAGDPLFHCYAVF